MIDVPAYTDFKLHDITDPADRADRRSARHEPAGVAPKFSAGNRRFLTRRLWGAANEPPYFHHGLFTTLRQAVLDTPARRRPRAAPSRRCRPTSRTRVIEFLKSLQVLPPGTTDLVVDENHRPKRWTSEMHADR